MTNEQETEHKKVSLTILLPAGRLPLPLLNKVNEIAREHKLAIYLSTAQNLRLLEVPEDKLEMIKKELAAVGAEFKKPGKFPLPKICVGKPHCNLGIVDTESLSVQILARFKDRKNVKPKFKIALAGCTLSCSGALLADIGVIATRKGYDLYVGGKGGPYPKVGRKIGRELNEEQVLDIIEKLVDFHDVKTAKKQRMIKLLDDPDFAFPELV